MPQTNPSRKGRPKAIKRRLSICVGNHPIDARALELTVTCAAITLYQCMRIDCPAELSIPASWKLDILFVNLYIQFIRSIFCMWPPRIALNHVYIFMYEVVHTFMLCLPSDSDRVWRGGTLRSSILMNYTNESWVRTNVFNFDALMRMNNIASRWHPVFRVSFTGHPRDDVLNVQTTIGNGQTTEKQRVNIRCRTKLVTDTRIITNTDEIMSFG